MISFRYHLVTIVAVFLALGLGLLAGTTVVDQGLVNRLKEQTVTANKAAEQLRVRVTAGETQLAHDEAFAAAALPALTTDRLLGQRVVIVTDEGTDAAVPARVLKVFDDAGANVTAVLSLTPQAQLQDPQGRATLAQILGMPEASTAGELQTAMATQLASRLATGPRGSQDLLLQLLDAGFLEAGKGSGLAKEGGELPAVGGPGGVIVAASGSVDVPAVAPRDFLIPFTQAIVKDRADSVAVEEAAATYPFVVTLRDMGVADGQGIVTVDNVDEAPGGLSLVLGTQDLIRTGQGANYGAKSGADRLFPPLQ